MLHQKTRSLSQIFKKKKEKRKICVCSRGHISSQILTKLGQNVCLDEISDKFLKMDHVELKNRSLSQIIEEPILVTKGL